MNHEDAGICLECGYPLELVRPGKVQCNYCDLLNMYEEELYDHAKTRRTLEAMIEENDKLQETIAQLQDTIDGEISRLKTCAAFIR